MIPFRNGRPLLFDPGREDGLEVRAFLFPRDHRDLDLTEPTLLQQLMQLHFAEAEPVIRVKFPRALEAVTEQVENDEASAFSQNAMRRLNGSLRVNRVVQRLAKNREV